MTTTHRSRPTAYHRAARPRGRMVQRAVAGALIGAAPGAILVLLAELVVDGEMQLTVGAPGIVLAIAGAVAGLVVALLHARRRNGTST